MAQLTQEQRRNAVAVPKQAFAFVAALALSLITTVGAGLWASRDILVQHGHWFDELKSRVTKLEDVADKGERFTRRDGDGLDARIDKLHAEMEKLTDQCHGHVSEYAHRGATVRFGVIERQISRLETSCSGQRNGGK